MNFKWTLNTLCLSNVARLRQIHKGLHNHPFNSRLISRPQLPLMFRSQQRRCPYKYIMIQWLSFQKAPVSSKVRVASAKGIINGQLSYVAHLRCTYVYVYVNMSGTFTNRSHRNYQHTDFICNIVGRYV